jgi:hypothetical protein
MGAIFLWGEGSQPPRIISQYAGAASGSGLLQSISQVEIGTRWIWRHIIQIVEEIESNSNILEIQTMWCPRGADTVTFLPLDEPR